MLLKGRTLHQTAETAYSRILAEGMTFNPKQKEEKTYQLHGFWQDSMME
jgi:hypothetical protein